MMNLEYFLINPFTMLLKDSSRSNWVTFTIGQRRALISQYGEKSNSYFNFQEGIEYFDVPGIGFLSYNLQKSLILGNYYIVFSRPICAEENMQELIEAFLDVTDGQVLFAGMDDFTSNLLCKFDYKMTQMGVEFNIPLENFSVSGKKMKYLRNIQNYDKRGLVVKELSWNQVDQESVKKISQDWMGGKQIKNRELRLLSRPPQFDEEWRVRKFYCYRDKELIGYVFFDPFFKEGEIAGYCANILRSSRDESLSGILDYIIITAIKKFQEEKVPVLALGLAPLHDLKKGKDENLILRTLSEFLYEYFNFLYHFKSLAFHKTRYRGTSEEIYLCTKNISNIKVLGHLLTATNIL